MNTTARDEYLVQVWEVYSYPKRKRGKSYVFDDWPDTLSYCFDAWKQGYKVDIFQGGNLIGWVDLHGFQQWQANVTDMGKKK